MSKPPEIQSYSEKAKTHKVVIPEELRRPAIDGKESLE